MIKLFRFHVDGTLFPLRAPYSMLIPHHTRRSSLVLVLLSLLMRRACLQRMASALEGGLPNPFRLAHAPAGGSRRLVLRGGPEGGGYVCHTTQFIIRATYVRMPSS